MFDEKYVWRNQCLSYMWLRNIPVQNRWKLPVTSRKIMKISKCNWKVSFIPCLHEPELSDLAFISLPFLISFWAIGSFLRSPTTDYRPFLVFFFGQSADSVLQINIIEFFGDITKLFYTCKALWKAMESAQTGWRISSLRLSKVVNSVHRAQTWTLSSTSKNRNLFQVRWCRFWQKCGSFFNS